MNRKSAKLLTVTGGFCCLAAVGLFVANLYNETNFPQIISFSLIVIGTILVTSSLAYYTEK